MGRSNPFTEAGKGFAAIVSSLRPKPDPNPEPKLDEGRALPLLSEVRDEKGNARVDSPLAVDSSSSALANGRRRMPVVQGNTYDSTASRNAMHRKVHTGRQTQVQWCESTAKTIAPVNVEGFVTAVSTVAVLGAAHTPEEKPIVQTHAQ